VSENLNPQTELLPTYTPELFGLAVKRAAQVLQAGGVAALPTETVYGLAANALEKNAVSRIFELKGRPPTNPIIVHFAELTMAKRCVSIWTPLAEKLARAFWPGPLTLVLLKSKEIPEIVTSDGPTVGIRWPSHPFIQSVIRECGFPLAAPSANPSNRLSPTNAQHVLNYFDGKIPVIVDGGPSQVGIESTVLDLSVSPPRLWRPGMIDENALLAVVGELAIGHGENHKVLKSPGQLPQHYSPRARLLVSHWRDEDDLRRQVAQQNVLAANVHVIAHTVIPSAKPFGRVSVIPHDAEAFARALYAELHWCDETGAGLIIVEAPPDSIEWRGIADRLNRAASS